MAGGCHAEPSFCPRTCPFHAGLPCSTRSSAGLGARGGQHLQSYGLEPYLPPVPPPNNANPEAANFEPGNVSYWSATGAPEMGVAALGSLCFMALLIAVQVLHGLYIVFWLRMFIVELIKLLFVRVSAVALYIQTQFMY